MASDCRALNLHTSDGDMLEFNEESLSVVCAESQEILVKSEVVK